MGSLWSGHLSRADIPAIAGLRYSFDNKKQEYRIYYNNAEGVKTYDSGIVSYGDTLTKPTWKLGVEYDLAANSMAYLQAAQGYKSGGVTFDYNMIQGDPLERPTTLSIWPHISSMRRHP